MAKKGGIQTYVDCFTVSTGGEALLASCVGCGHLGQCLGSALYSSIAFVFAGSLRRFQPMHKKELVIQVSFPHTEAAEAEAEGGEGRAPRFSFSDCSLSLSLSSVQRSPAPRSAVGTEQREKERERRYVGNGTVLRRWLGGEGGGLGGF